MTAANDLAVRRALEGAGVEFIDANGGGPGVGLRQSMHKMEKWSDGQTNISDHAIEAELRIFSEPIVENTIFNVLSQGYITKVVPIAVLLEQVLPIAVSMSGLHPPDNRIVR